VLFGPALSQPQDNPAQAAPDLSADLHAFGLRLPYGCRELEGSSDWEADLAKDAEIASLRQCLEVRFVRTCLH
jgi:hypothetical protein